MCFISEIHKQICELRIGSLISCIMWCNSWNVMVMDRNNCSCRTPVSLLDPWGFFFVTYVCWTPVDIGDKRCSSGVCTGTCTI